MAQTLRGLSHIARSVSLSQAIAWLGVGLILLPLLPGLLATLLPAFSTEVWHNIAANNQIRPALMVTLLTSFASTILALWLACSAMMRFYPSQRWRKLQQQAPAFLAFPHAAFAIGLAFLLAPSGALARLMAQMMGWDAPPQWVSIQDPYGISLTLALALKESWFLLWVLFSLLNQQWLQRQMIQAQSMGYSARQIWQRILLPQILPKLGWPLLAVFAYSLSVVDMAIILGPSIPPTLAVLGWQWFNDPEIAKQHMASAVSLIMLLLLLLGVTLARSAMRLWRWQLAQPNGLRKAAKPKRRWLPSAISLNQAIAVTVLSLLLLWSLADSWFFPQLWPQSLSLSSWLNADYQPLWTSLWIAICCVSVALPLSLLWLEWGPKQHAWLYLPLILPALPLAASQYQVLLYSQLDHSGIGVVWSHLAWVLPYMILILSGAYRAFDDRLMLIAQSMGSTRFQACFKVKWPLLFRPIMAALAIGFAVSIAQYLPTLFAGGGRFETVATEAVALSAGGNRRVLAVQAVLQTLLPLLVFASASALGFLYARQRQGLS